MSETKAKPPPASARPEIDASDYSDSDPETVPLTDEDSFNESSVAVAAPKASTNAKSGTTGATKPPKKTPTATKKPKGSVTPAVGEQDQVLRITNKLDKEFLDNLIGEISEAETVIDTDGSYSGQDSKSEENYEDDSSDSDAAPRKSQKTSAKSSPSKGGRLPLTRSRSNLSPSRNKQRVVSTPVRQTACPPQAPETPPSITSSVRRKLVSTLFEDDPFSKLADAGRKVRLAGRYKGHTDAWFAPDKTLDSKGFRNNFDANRAAFEINRKSDDVFGPGAKQDTKNAKTASQGPYFTHQNGVLDDSDAV